MKAINNQWRQIMKYRKSEIIKRQKSENNESGMAIKERHRRRRGNA